MQYDLRSVVTIRAGVHNILQMGCSFVTLLTNYIRSMLTLRYNYTCTLWECILACTCRHSHDMQLLCTLFRTYMYSNMGSSSCDLYVLLLFTCSDVVACL